MMQPKHKGNTIEYQALDGWNRKSNEKENKNLWKNNWNVSEF